MKEIVICCDGTWNTPDDLDGGLPAPTNVVKLRNALATHNEHGAIQLSYYHPGVGTDGGWWDRAAGGGMGQGLGKNVKSAYKWLAGVYEPGDRIWLFGFSRGAFTVRSLSGMISQCGLLNFSAIAKNPDAIWAAVDAVYDAYRKPVTDKPKLKASKDLAFHGVKAGSATARSTPIHFIGVWDTVGALGIPDDMALLDLIDEPAAYEFHDTNLSPVVVHARHAIALDERRHTFEPTIWVDDPPLQNLKQVWFPGVHSDVGGGYGRCGLSDGALRWMIDEATEQGLAFVQSRLDQIKPNHHDVLHDSLTGVFKTLKTRPRAAPLVDATPSNAVHESAWDRHRDPPIVQGAYWPKGPFGAPIEIFARQHWNSTGLYLQRGKTYQFKAEGQWKDSSIPSGPGGTSDGKFHLGEAAHLVGSAIGKLEQAYKWLSKNLQADFWLTLREENFPWFALIGVVANGWKPKENPRTAPHEAFLIGEKRTFTPKASGYLYCFANDAWQTYDNNRGSVTLTVTEKP